MAAAIAGVASSLRPAMAGAIAMPGVMAGAIAGMAIAMPGVIAMAGAMAGDAIAIPGVIAMPGAIAMGVRTRATAAAEPLMAPLRPSGKKRPLPFMLPAVTMEMTWDKAIHNSQNM